MDIGLILRAAQDTPGQAEEHLGEGRVTQVYTQVRYQRNVEKSDLVHFIQRWKKIVEYEFVRPNHLDL